MNMLSVKAIITSMYRWNARVQCKLSGCVNSAGMSSCIIKAFGNHVSPSHHEKFLPKLLPGTFSSSPLHHINQILSFITLFLDHQLSGRPLQALAMNKRSEIVYNMGVQLLFAGKPVAAFDCFMEANDFFECHPRFWLRLAESCIMVHQQVHFIMILYVFIALSSAQLSFIPRTWNLWNGLPSSCFLESYNLPSFKSKISKLHLISLSS